MCYLNYLYVALGGALGATGRYIVSMWVNNKYQSVFPYGTFIVNVAGCFVLGVFYTLTLDKSVLSPQIRTAVNVGFIGAFTTFSTFSLETLNIIRENNIKIALTNIVFSVIVGLLAVWLGMTFSNLISKP